eukprot:5002814-Prorocentrum_lima.AAC.1
MRTMLALGNMQQAMEGQESHLGYCKARGLQKWTSTDITDVLITTKPGGPRWKDVLYRTVIDEESGETLIDMESVDGVPEAECLQDCGGRPRKLTTILHYKTTGSARAGATWSLGSLDVKTAFLYAELNEEEDGIIVVQPPAVLVRLGLVEPG